ncbi:transcriptional regulator, AraC family [Geomicrobium sp. JCM 19039]|nr:transcriptional regulator, AraC family [Geomicrobium sp. JCM 19039]
MAEQMHVKHREEELIKLVNSFARVDGIHNTNITGLSIIRSSTPLEPIKTLHQPALCMIIQGGKVVSLNGEDYSYGNGDYLVVAVDLPVVGEVVKASEEEPYLCLRLDFDQLQLVNSIGSEKQKNDNLNISKRGLFVSQTTGALLDAWLRLLTLLKTPNDKDFLAPLITKEILYRVMKGEQGERIQLFAARGSKMSEIAKAINYLKQHYATKINIEELAKHVNLSAPAFYQHFKQVTAMTPIQYQKSLRLHEARRLMIREHWLAPTRHFMLVMKAHLTSRVNIRKCLADHQETI